MSEALAVAMERLQWPLEQQPKRRLDVLVFPVSRHARLKRGALGVEPWGRLRRAWPAVRALYKRTRASFADALADVEADALYEDCPALVRTPETAPAGVPRWLVPVPVSVFGGEPGAMLATLTDLVQSSDSFALTLPDKSADSAGVRARRFAVGAIAALQRRQDKHGLRADARVALWGSGLYGSGLLGTVRGAWEEALRAHRRVLMCVERAAWVLAPAPASPAQRTLTRTGRVGVKLNTAALREAQEAHKKALVKQRQQRARAKANEEAQRAQEQRERQERARRAREQQALQNVVPFRMARSYTAPPPPCPPSPSPPHSQAESAHSAHSAHSLDSAMSGFALNDVQQSARLALPWADM